MGLENEYFRERALDIQDLKHKILYAIFGVGTEYQISIPSVIFAEFLSPSDTVHFNRNIILGFVTDTGGKTSHAAILARSYSIPVISGIHNISEHIRPGDQLYVDADKATVYIRPAGSVISRFHEAEKKTVDLGKTLQKKW